MEATTAQLEEGTAEAGPREPELGPTASPNSKTASVAAHRILALITIPSPQSVFLPAFSALWLLPPAAAEGKPGAAALRAARPTDSLVADPAATAGAAAACEHGDQQDGDRKSDSHGDQQVSPRKCHCEAPFS
jgi:hypothetical protein